MIDQNGMYCKLTLGMVGKSVLIRHGIDWHSERTF